MSRFRSKLGVCILAFSLTAGVVSTPGCQQVASFLLKLLIQVGRDVAASFIGKFVEQKLDSWVFNKNSSENQGGDVVPTSGNSLTGKYNGTMEITVTDSTGKKSTVKVSNPRMIRDSTSSNWKLDPSLVQTAKERTEESFGK